MPAERRPRAVHLLLLLGVGAVRALVRPGECVINGECQRDPERLHGLQDWAGYASHGSGHLPARYSANRPPGRWAAWGVSAVEDGPAMLPLFVLSRADSLFSGIPPAH